MSEDIRIWKIEDSSKAASPLEPANRMETEHALEELLVSSPGMLMPGLVLIGRQTPIDGGALDLLGVDERRSRSRESNPPMRRQRSASLNSGTCDWTKRPGSSTEMGSPRLSTMCMRLGRRR